MPAVIQRSFAGGILSETLNARADLARYQQGLRRARNCHVLRNGALVNRAGTEFVGETKAGDDTPVRLIPFRFNDEQTYMIEAGFTGVSGYFRWYQNGERLRLSSTPAAWLTSTAYDVGDLRSNGGTNYYCYVAHTSSAGDEPGVGGSYTTYWHELEDDIYEIPHDFTEDELMGTGGERPLGYVQANDVIVLLHQNHAPRTLTRVGATEWIISVIDFVPEVQRPTYCEVTGPAPSGSGAERRYIVTAIDGQTGKESIASPGPEIDSAGWSWTTTTLGVSTSGAHGLSVGDLVTVGDLATPLAANNRAKELYQLLYGQILEVLTTPTASTLTLVIPSYVSDAGLPSVATFSAPLHEPYASGTFKATLLATETIDITWPAVPGATRYAVYKDSILAGNFGFVGYAQGPGDTIEFKDGGPDGEQLPAYEDVAPVAFNPFIGSNNFPAVGGFYQQRLVLASTVNKPATIWFSRAGDIYNFTYRTPLQDDDSFERDVTGRDAQQVYGLVDLGQKFVILTSEGEWAMSAESGAATVDDFTIRQDGYNGSSALRPLVANRTVLYNQARGSAVLDLRYQFESDSYVGEDLTTFASELVDGFTITSWSYANIPHPTVYACRSDGALLLFTYIAEQNVAAWTQADTRGTISSSQEQAADKFLETASIPEGVVDTPYFVVQRRIGSSLVNYIERLAPRKANQPGYDVRSDARFLDSHITFDGTNTTSDTITPSEYLGGGWASGATITLTKTNGGGSGAFDTDDAVHPRGYRLAVTKNNGDSAEFEVIVTTYVSATVVRGTIRSPRVAGAIVSAVDSEMHGVPTTAWVRMERFFTGLDHLDNEQVKALADGVVYTEDRVSSGVYTMPDDDPRGIVTIGLPIYVEAEMLDIDFASGESTISSVIKHVPWADLHLKQSKNVTAGPEATVQEALVTHTTDPLTLCDGKHRAQTPSQADKDGRITIVQPDPLPMTILAVTRAVELGDL